MRRLCIDEKGGRLLCVDGEISFICKESLWKMNSSSVSQVSYWGRKYYVSLFHGEGNVAHHIDEFIVVDLSVTVLVNSFNHILPVAFGVVLEGRVGSQHSLEFCLGDFSVPVEIEHLEGKLEFFLFHVDAFFERGGDEFVVVDFPGTVSVDLLDDLKDFFVAFLAG